MGLFDFLFGNGSNFDMTKDYIGKHGEFNRNDEDRAMCEDMFAMRAHEHDADVESHFGWENKLNYDSDGYSDEEDW